MKYFKMKIFNAGFSIKLCNMELQEFCLLTQKFIENPVYNKMSLILLECFEINLILQTFRFQNTK